ncbi:hypothetical protein [Marimonas arenosa]|uniref:Uncharacterized protein n=1 Tax=Marimonas arenosa TaxID=1795305 RepID=A0AAE4B3Y2_9RHOB|nr:hypothetical protein [Marimonas arenosa]MDQ2090513.1 hypothetical protein [Marimonas arenosa]
MHRLAALLVLLPTHALADVCAQERPDWDPARGPATGLDELVFLFTSLPGLGILGAITLAVLTGQKRYFAISAVFATLIGAALYVQSTAPDDIRRTAIAEGCVGPQTIPIATCAVIALISAASLAWLWLRDRPADRI